MVECWKRQSWELWRPWPGFEDEAAGFGVNGDAGKAGEQTVAKEARFAGEDWVLV